MNYTNLICGAGLLVSAAPSLAWAQQDARPNIVVILADDAGYNDFGFMGSKELQTPNIDKLSSQGTVFTDGHVAATVSSPSRACLLTGRYGHRFGYECNLDNPTDGLSLNEETLGDIFGRAGYRTATIGKWHLGGLPEFHPNRRGFQLFYGMLSGHRHYFYDEKKSDAPGSLQNLQLNGEKQKFDGYLTDRFTDKAIDFIQESNQPFMLYLSYNAVHTPMEALPEDMARFKGHPRQKLAAMTYALDRGVGRVVQALKESGKFDNTLIYFLSDNGGATTNTSSNYPYKGFKGNKFEGGHRVPFFVVWNGKIPAGKQYEGLVSSLDIAATAVDAAHITQTKQQLDGVSLLPYLMEGKKGNPHSSLYWRKMDTRAIRQGDYKLIITHGVDSVLYNVKKNPEETVNLMHSHPKVYRKLAKNLAEWEATCVEPLWIEKGWDTITNGIHRFLMHNEGTTAADYIRSQKGKK